MDNMADVDVRELLTEVAVLRTKVEGLEQGRFAALEAKVDASREGLEVKSDTTRALIEEQGKRMDRLNTAVVTTRSELRDDIKGTRNFLTGALAAATALITIVQFFR